MNCLTTQVQNRLVRKRWPTFKTLRRSQSAVLWEGTLRPLCKTYTVWVGLRRSSNDAEASAPSCSWWIQSCGVDQTLLKSRYPTFTPTRIRGSLPCPSFAYTTPQAASGTVAWPSHRRSFLGLSTGSRATRAGSPLASGLAAVSTEAASHGKEVIGMEANTKRRVLSIDGGGLKGVMPAAFLAQIEETTKQRIVDHFDLVVGTSTGGIIALGIGLGIPCPEILQFYLRHGPGVFGAPHGSSRTATVCVSLWRTVRRLVTNKHKPAPLSVALKDVFGDRRLGESSTRLVVPAWDSQRRHPCLFKTAHHPRFEVDYAKSVVDIAMATAAAPTYLPAHLVRGVEYVDGGLWANNPATVAAVEATVVLGWEAENTLMLSLGCTDETLVVPKRMGIFHGARIGVDMLLQGQAQSALKTAEILLGGDTRQRERVRRVDMPVERGFAELDDAKQIGRLEGFGREQARQWLPILRREFLDGRRPAFAPCRDVGSKSPAVCHTGDLCGGGEHDDWS